MIGQVEFPFVRMRSRALGVVQRPLIPVTLSGPDQELEARFLLDSGADISLIPYSLGRILGLSREGAQRGECRGVGEGLVAYHQCPINIRIGDIPLTIRIGWSTLEETPLLLGRLDVFDALDVEFRQHSARIVLRLVGSERS